MARSSGQLLVGPGAGRMFPFGPAQLEVKVGAETGARGFRVFESSVAGGPAPHRHAVYEEAFYVLEGRIAYRLGDDWVEASAGSSVFVPAGMVHCFHTVGEQPARHLVMVSPPEALDLIEALGQTAPTDWPAIMARFDSEFM